MSDPIIEINNISKTYVHFRTRLSRFLGSLVGGSEKLSGSYWEKRILRFPVLNNISLSIPKGQATAIVGFNGSGKSTLLQLIAGTLSSSSGQIITRGKIAALLELGSGFNPEFTGVENVYLNGTLFGLSRKEISKRLPQIEAFADIGEYINQPVRTYSSGMMVRLAFSVLTQVDADILIVDEALAVGDMHFQHKCIQHIKKLVADGTTLLFVSHDPSSVKAVCSRAVLLHEGKILTEGASSIVYDYYNALIAERDHSHQIEQNESGGVISTKSGNKKLEIKNARLTDSHGNVLAAAEIGTKMRIIINCVSNENLSDVAIGFIIRDRVGYDVFGTNTAELGHAIVKNEGQSLEVCFEVDLFLGSGTYSLSVSAHSSKNHYDDNYHWIDNILSFEVLNKDKFNSVGTSRLPTQVTYS